MVSLIRGLNKNVFIDLLIRRYTWMQMLLQMTKHCFEENTTPFLGSKYLRLMVRFGRVVLHNAMLCWDSTYLLALGELVDLMLALHVSHCVHHIDYTT